MTGPETPQNQGVEGNVASNRSILVEQWRNAPYEVLHYPAGKITDSQGNVLYEYQEGRRLMMLGQEVMDSCQWPWTESTVDDAFTVLRRPFPLASKTNVQILERGFGMGLVASRIMQRLGIVGGEYTCIELNEQIAQYADTIWRDEQNRITRDRTLSIMGGDNLNVPYIPINIVRGDAFEETEKLVAAGRKFDIIVSDTYPLSDEEKSVNDLLDIEQLIKCLAPEGIFVFFGFHTGSDGGLNYKQTNLISKRFNAISSKMVQVAPPPDYKYFNPPSGPVRELPVILCAQPVIEP